MSREPSGARCRGRAAQLIGAGAVAFIAARLCAQDQGPVVLTRETQLESIRLMNLRMSLETYVRRQVDEIDPVGSEKTRDTEDRWETTLELATDGFIGHPNLIELNLIGRFRLAFEDLDNESNDLSGRTTEDIIDYNVSALFLKESSAPLTIYSLRNQTTFDRQFAPSIDSVVTEHGARLVVRRPKIPSVFTYFHRDEEQSSSLDGTDFDLVQDTFEWHTEWNMAAGQTLTWDYTFDSIDESGELRTANSFDRHDGQAEHLWKFGEDVQDELRSTLFFYKETGLFPLDRIRLTEALRLRHTRNFETRYDYLYENQDRPQSEQTFQRGTVGFEHRLFESLVTNAEAGVSRLEVLEDNFTSDQYFGQVGFDYHKRVPYGRLSAGLALSLSQTDDSESGASIQVANEPHVFGTSGRVVINRRNIEPGSIVMTDSAGIILFSENSDYSVRALADGVELRRILGGDIVDGQRVLVDYVVGPEPGGTTTRNGYGVTVRYDFDEGPLRGLGLYTRYFDQNEDRDHDDPRAQPEADTQDLIYGVDYTFWLITLNAEQEFRDSTLSPFERTRLDGTLVYEIGRRSALVLTGTYDDIDFTDDDIQSTVATVTARWNQQLTRRLRSSLVLTWRDERDSAGIDVQGFEQWLDLTWQYRQTTIYGRVYNSILESDISDTLSQTFQLGLRRDF